MLILCDYRKKTSKVCRKLFPGEASPGKEVIKTFTNNATLRKPSGCNGSFGKAAQKRYANGPMSPSPAVESVSHFLTLLAANAGMRKVFTDVYILCSGSGYELWKISMIVVSFPGLHLMCHSPPSLDSHSASWEPLRKPENTARAQKHTNTIKRRGRLTNTHERHDRGEETLPAYRSFEIHTKSIKFGSWSSTWPDLFRCDQKS